ncbi:MAG: lysozyme inhibitor LprI family protein [Flavipsychrobacter sp.]
MRRLLLGLIILFSFKSATHAQTTIDPIDKAYANCKQAHNTPAGMANCAFDAYKSWNNELNKYYNRTLKLLRKQGDISSLKNAQKAWTAFRDAEFTAYNNMFNKSGDRWTAIRAENRIALVRARALQLRNYYDSLQVKR